jgi:Uma2 family endonuclease
VPNLNALKSMILTINLKPIIDLTDALFFELCQVNPDIRLERTALGQLVIMPSIGGETENQIFRLSGQLGVWVEQDQTGVGFGSSTAFNLPNGAIRSPSVAWVKSDRWNSLTSKQREGFPPIAPDFVVELRSKTDSLADLNRWLNQHPDPPKVEKRVGFFRLECLANLGRVRLESLQWGYLRELLQIQRREQ